MQPDSGRRDITRKGVAVGSVWERRMKMDELNGGIKVFNGGGDSCDDEERVLVYRRLRRNQSDGGAEKRKRRSWKQPEMGAANRTPVKLSKARSAGIGTQMEVGENGVLLITDGKETRKKTLILR
ncbi:hypothetical protein HPP92_003754 [Vanilla planifolia]|uniref:Uncharacterized protein n=1 Tax=Vanilla planifolia TaxID=51239 RepID=A0A835RY71_VANPL|nr:hypothetical protein HPP92_003754 [Vanilla planifolia]